MKFTESNKTAARREAVYRFHNEHGLPLFERIKLRFPDGSKIVTYQYGIGGGWAIGRALKTAVMVKEKPIYNGAHADDYLYHLPELLAGIRSGVGDIYWTEGESDCQAVELEDAIATSHHGGAGKVHPRQAEWFRGFDGRVIVCRDLDDIGALDAVRRVDLLAAVGVSGVEVRGPATGKDVRDHLEAGLGLSELVPWDLGALRSEAARVPRGSVYRYTLPAAAAAMELELIEGLGPGGEGWRMQYERRPAPVPVSRPKWNVPALSREQWRRA